jgi:hypothetical protein
VAVGNYFYSINLFFHFLINYMSYLALKKLTIFPVLGLLVTCSYAQTVKVSPGKKIQTVSDITLTTTVNQMGMDMEIPATSHLNMNFEVKAVENKKISLSATLKKITGAVTIMGSEKKYDSDDSATANNPMIGALMKNLNKPQDLTVEVGKPLSPNDITGAQSSDEIADGLFIPVNGASVKEGFTWSDSSSSSEGSSVINHYTVMKVSKEELVVRVLSTCKIITTQQQMGMEMKINMQGASTGTRSYNLTTGILKSSTNTFTASGNNEMMGNTIPVTMKGTAVITAL